MPNGGMLPCCFVCQWAKKDTSKPFHPRDNNPLIEPIDCQQHGFAVWLPSHHVCALLNDSPEESGFSTFAERAGLVSGTIYAWLEFSYRTEQHPHLPQYHHECVKLASVQEFSDWQLEQKKDNYSRLRSEKEQKLFSKTDDTKET